MLTYRGWPGAGEDTGAGDDENDGKGNGDGVGDGVKDGVIAGEEELTAVDIVDNSKEVSPTRDDDVATNDIENAGEVEADDVPADDDIAANDVDNPDEFGTTRDDDLAANSVDSAEDVDAGRDDGVAVDNVEGRLELRAVEVPEEAVEEDTMEAREILIEESLDGAIGEGCDGTIEEALDGTTEEALEEAIGEALGKPIGDELEEACSNALDEAIEYVLSEVAMEELNEAKEETLNEVAKGPASDDREATVDEGKVVDELKEPTTGIPKPFNEVVLNGAAEDAPAGPIRDAWIPSPVEGLTTTPSEAPIVDKVVVKDLEDNDVLTAGNPPFIDEAIVRVVAIVEVAAFTDVGPTTLLVAVECTVTITVFVGKLHEQNVFAILLAAFVTYTFFLMARLGEPSIAGGVWTPRLTTTVTVVLGVGYFFAQKLEAAASLARGARIG
ncbi:hypothetical protein T440DRAFT_545654 [Plenodomus tracheiphilus IPT5]|uniref:Uncharacterized protein n=1 Tax=Plenodomus tracheiphilus IPT5 TaxID=1408161 RepID=A0A6A7AQT1_9PLEO|nr:hypothetical protein T440DRAFT_545654 [Plenodomus tracheiphilus IPT5]